MTKEHAGLGTILVDKLVMAKAEALQAQLQKFAISYDLYTCVAAVLNNKIPQDVMPHERATAKNEVYKYTYSN